MLFVKTITRNVFTATLLKNSRCGITCWMSSSRTILFTPLIWYIPECTRNSCTGIGSCVRKFKRLRQTNPFDDTIFLHQNLNFKIIICLPDDNKERTLNVNPKTKSTLDRIMPTKRINPKLDWILLLSGKSTYVQCN